MQNARKGLNDHRRIKWSKEPWLRFRPEEAAAADMRARVAEADADRAIVQKKNDLRKVTAELDYHAFWLADTNDFWYRSNGLTTVRPLSPNAGNFVGTELDFVLTWKACQHLQLLAHSLVHWVALCHCGTDKPFQIRVHLIRYGFKILAFRLRRKWILFAQLGGQGLHSGRTSQFLTFLK